MHAHYRIALLLVAATMLIQFTYCTPGKAFWQLQLGEIVLISTVNSHYVPSISRRFDSPRDSLSESKSPKPMEKRGLVMSKISGNRENQPHRDAYGDRIEEEANALLAPTELQDIHPTDALLKYNMRARQLLAVSQLIIINEYYTA